MWFILFISLLIILLEKGIFSVLFSTGFIPQLLTITVISLGIWKVKNDYNEINMTKFAFVIFLSSVVYDIISGGYLGLSSFINLNVFLLIILLGKLLSGKSSFLSIPLGIIVGTFFYNLLWFLFYKLIGQNFNYSFRTLIIQLVGINLVTGIFLSLFLSFIFDRILGKKEIEI